MKLEICILVAGKWQQPERWDKCNFHFIPSGKDVKMMSFGETSYSSGPLLLVFAVTCVDGQELYEILNSLATLSINVQCTQSTVGYSDLYLSAE